MHAGRDGVVRRKGDCTEEHGPVLHSLTRMRREPPAAGEPSFPNRAGQATCGPRYIAAPRFEYPVQQGVMPSFDDIGLRDELLRTLEDEELDRPTALQAAVLPTLRRGGNLVARASSGSGKTLAYGLGVLDRLRPDTEASDEDGAALTRMVVLTPTREGAERVGLALAPYVQSVGFAVAAAGGAWGTPLAAAEVVTGTPGDVMDAVRTSALKFDRLEALVIDGASAIASLGGLEMVDSIMDLIPRDAQRVVLTTALPEEVEDLVARRVKRAIRYPAEPAVPDETPPAPLEGRIGYVLLSAAQKLEVLARQLGAGEEGGTPPILFLGSDERAAQLAEQLSVRGFVVGAIDDADADVAVVSSATTRAELLAEADGGLGQTISFEVPADAETLLARHGGDDDAIVLLEPREVPHLREIARMARLRPEPRPLPLGSEVGAELAAFRDSLRKALREEDLGAQLLVLEPLLDQYPAHEVAAAAAALLRRRPQPATPAAPPAETFRAASNAGAQGGSSAPAGRPARGGAGAGGAPATWTRLYVGVGSRDEVRPADLVGALAGEADIRGAQIGKIEIRDNFSIVEVEAAVADRVIRAVNGTTVKGRSVRVDYDRGAERAKRGPGSDRPAFQRRATRRPPRRE